MSSISNIPYTTRSVNGIITLSDGVAQMQNGALTNLSTLDTDSITTQSFATNDFVVNTNIDLTADTSKIQFLYGANPNNTVIDRFKIDTTNVFADNIYGDLSGNVVALTGSFSTSLRAPTVSLSDNSLNVATTEWVKAQGYSTGGIPANIDCSSIIVINDNTAINQISLNSNNDNANPTIFNVSRLSSSPATNDKLFRLNVNGSRITGGTNYNYDYGFIDCRIDDHANGWGGWWFDTNKNGSMLTRMHINNEKVHITNVDDFLVSATTQMQIDSPLIEITNGRINQSSIPTGQKNEFQASDFTQLFVDGVEITAGAMQVETLAQVLGAGNSAGSNNINMNNKDILNCALIDCTKGVFDQVDASSSFVENLTFSNVSSDIAITNWNASTPVYVSNGYYLQYGGTGTYTGLSGFIFSGTGYQVYILRGINNGVFFLTYFPPGITTNQCFVLQTQQNKTINAKTINYTLQAGGYTFGFWMQSSVGGTGQFLDWDVYVKNSSNVVLGQLMNLAPSNAYPNWVFYTINFNLTTQTTVYFEFQSSSNNYIYGGYVCLVGLELTLNNSILVRDTATGKTATISGAQSILNAVSVNDGISINNGGLTVIGGISSSTATGSGNTTMNTILGQTSNPVNNVAIGDSALQSGTTASQNVIIGASAVPFSTTISNNVAIGFNANLGTTTEKSVVIGSRQIVRGNNTVAIGNFDFIATTQGAIGQNCVGIGSNILGANVGNGFGVLSTQDSVAIGNSSQYNCTDRFNNSIGVESLFNLNGRNGVVANGNSGRITQYNNAFGYRAGYNQQRYNNCTFIGAFADGSVDNLFNSVAIGHNCLVDNSNVIQLGSNSETVRISGALRIGGDLSNITTINGQPYVAGGGGSVGTLSQVLTNGNNANGLGIINLGASNMNGQLDISGNVFINNTTLYITRGGGSLSTDGTTRINHWDYATSIESNFISEANNNSFNLSIGKGTPNVNKIGTGYSNRIETIAVGYNALSNLTTGESNTAIGVNGGINTTTGSNNTFIGRYAGDANNYNNCTFIGANTDASVSVANSTAIGHGTLVDISNCIQLGSNGETVRISGLANCNAGIIPSTISLAITGTTNLTSSSCGSITYLASSTASNTINLPSVSTTRAGAIIQIVNYSSHQHTLTSTANIGGSYGSNTTTQIINIGQSYEFVLQSGQWRCIQVSGVPYSYVRYHNVAETVATMNYTALYNSVGGSVDGGNVAWNLDSWNGARLTYGSGIFTNSTGFPMTVQVQALTNTSPITNAVFIGVLPGGSVRHSSANPAFYQKGGATNATGVAQSQWTLYLASGDSFRVVYGASASTTFGSATANLSSRIIITRIS